VFGEGNQKGDHAFMDVNQTTRATRLTSLSHKVDSVLFMILEQSKQQLNPVLQLRDAYDIGVVFTSARRDGAI